MYPPELFYELPSDISDLFEENKIAINCELDKDDDLLIFKYSSKLEMEFIKNPENIRNIEILQDLERIVVERYVDQYSISEDIIYLGNNEIINLIKKLKMLEIKIVDIFGNRILWKK